MAIVQLMTLIRIVSYLELEEMKPKGRKALKGGKEELQRGTRQVMKKRLS